MRYFILKVSKGKGLIVAGYDEFDRGDKHFIENTTFESVSVWVKNIGFYCCNSFDFETSGTIDVIIDIKFKTRNKLNDFDILEFKKYHSLLIELLDKTVKKYS